MASVRAANRSDVAGMAGGGKPVVHGRADRSAADRGLSRPLVTGDEKDEPLPAADRLVEAAIDRLPRTIEAHSVQVDYSVGLDRAASEAAIPCAVQRSSDTCFGGCGDRLADW